MNTLHQATLLDIVKAPTRPLEIPRILTPDVDLIDLDTSVDSNGSDDPDLQNMPSLETETEVSKDSIPSYLPYVACYKYDPETNTVMKKFVEIPTDQSLPLYVPDEDLSKIEHSNDVIQLTLKRNLESLKEEIADAECLNDDLSKEIEEFKTAIKGIDQIMSEMKRKAMKCIYSEHFVGKFNWIMEEGEVKPAFDHISIEFCPKSSNSISVQYSHAVGPVDWVLSGQKQESTESVAILASNQIELINHDHKYREIYTVLEKTLLVHRSYDDKEYKLLGVFIKDSEEVKENEVKDDEELDLAQENAAKQSVVMKKALKKAFNKGFCVGYFILGHILVTVLFYILFKQLHLYYLK